LGNRASLSVIPPLQKKKENRRTPDGRQREGTSRLPKLDAKWHDIGQQLFEGVKPKGNRTTCLQADRFRKDEAGSGSGGRRGSDSAAASQQEADGQPGNFGKTSVITTSKKKKRKASR